ncbi:hypothetical protein [uncultured Nevskia sp.]|uniref:type II toxin-antitoxin system Phd/YefM family antitoxin n=1 Tax=uncultured Nevskia sp. TaxID=228950 RepID=UPI0025EF9F5C|nr:hypothetical protein [uncultured Nevskia sp.]
MSEEVTLVTVTEARAKMCELIRRAQHGEVIGLIRRGKTVAWLHPMGSKSSPQSLSEACSDS